MTSALWSSFFLEIAFKSMAVLMAAWLVRLALRRSSAAILHVLWVTTFAALLALPVLSLALPAMRVPVAGSLRETGFFFQANASSATLLNAAHAAQPTGASFPAAGRWLLNWHVLLLLAWALGASLSLGQMLAGWWMMERSRRRANRFSAPVFVSLRKLFAIQTRVDLLESPKGSMPMTFGLFRSAIFLPADAAQWSAERLRLVLLHELAHVRRADGATHMLGAHRLEPVLVEPVGLVCLARVPQVAGARRR